ncbi:dicarboxylate/amino acid:cation symporter [Stieleria varia]|uniref:Proton glutamate symport protein n=1 Tax=Stieleria varia TaxID=2528005 RepID=A0A5C6B318_9BACT|nr:dicarboxylate/amino acid:cation symporter [Stieleria varia]TWU05759.1 Proton glutamate symport protein [Stieleria varia]
MSDTESAKSGHGSRLTLYICVAIIAAIILALVAPHFAESLDIGGELFLRTLKMIVVPLVFTSVMCGIMGMGDVRKLGRPGAAAIGYYLATTVLAVIVGLIVVNIMRPGVGTVDQAAIDKLGEGGMGTPKSKIIKSISEDSGLSQNEVSGVLQGLPDGEAEQPGVGTIIKNLALMLVTDNLFVSAANTQLLPIIVFAIILAALMTTMGKEVATVQTFIEQSNELLMKFVLLLMKAAPLGIFCLVAARFGKAQVEAIEDGTGGIWAELMQIGWYFSTVLVGLGLHAFITLPLIFYIVRRENPYVFMYRMSKALLMAFSTASSSATLPVTLECCEEAGVSEKSTEFVVPLGATINMDGTALYEAAAAIFIAQTIPGFDLSFTTQMIIAVTATLAAIGAAGIPEAGLVTMLIVLNAVGLPLEYIGLILTVDWLLDRFRTAVNVFGDSIGAAVVEKALPPEPVS